MRILHIGWGFRPFRWGGLIEYAEDLMKIQAEKGWEVYYLFSGRSNRLYSRTRIKQWKKNGVIHYELLNNPNIYGFDLGTCFPENDLYSPVIEKLVIEVISKINPEIIHIQELVNLPSSLIDIIKDQFSIPIVFTLQDYFPLCPNLKLFTSDNVRCEVSKVGNICEICCVNAPRNKKSIYSINRTYIKLRIKKHLNRIWILKYFISLVRNLKKLIRRNIKKVSSKKNKLNNKAEIYQLRRELNLKRLEKVDLLLAQSKKVETIYSNFLGSNNLKNIKLTLKHIATIKPKNIILNNRPIRIGTLNGFASVPKGAFLLLNVLEIAKTKNLEEKFELHSWGNVLQNVSTKLKKFNNVYIHDQYEVSELNNILDSIDVGIIPSLWEEAYGFVGIEFLAKAIPIIGNNRGGIIDYTINNLTGWVSTSCTAESIISIIENIIDNPGLVVEINKKIITNYNSIIKTMDEHFDEIGNIYKEVIHKNNIKSMNPKSI